MAPGKKEDKGQDYEKQLAPFLQRHQLSQIKKVRNRPPRIVNPWNDDSLVILLEPDSDQALINALNNLVLPPRFTAIYHIDTNTMEFIYTIEDKEAPCFYRQFDFVLEGKSYLCRFAKSSERLLLISKLFRRMKSSKTDYRQLLPFRQYLGASQAPSDIDDSFLEMEPLSFYVSGFQDFNEDEIIEVSKHINFLSQYYDRDCPYIIIHPAETELAEIPRQLQFIENTFPEKISSRRYDPFLLDLALEASRVGSRLQFIYYFQILEYVAFYFVEDDIRRRLLNIIGTPDIHSNPDRYVLRILEVIGPSIRQEDEARIQKVVKASCNPTYIWQEVQQNLSYFSESQQFDGGFTLEPLVSEDISLESFCAMWHPKTVDTARFIRNALVHGREKRFGPVISPTPRNDILIKPWATIIRRMAEQVIVFGRST